MQPFSATTFFTRVAVIIAIFYYQVLKGIFSKGLPCWSQQNDSYIKVLNVLRSCNSPPLNLFSVIDLSAIISD